jgi:hypothetical protein
VVVAKDTPSLNLRTRRIAAKRSKVLTGLSMNRYIFANQRLFGRTLRLEPATGSRKVYGEGSSNAGRFQRSDREGRRDAGRDDGRFQRSDDFHREFSTLRPIAAGFVARRPVQLTQVNALVGRRMFGFAASLVFKRRLV